MSAEIKDEVGTRVLFENDDIKVWDLQLQPGENQGMHRHKNEYLLIFAGDCRLRGVNEDGSVRFEQDMHDGDAFMRTFDGDNDVHDAVNVGDSPSRNFIVEFKR